MEDDIHNAKKRLDSYIEKIKNSKISKRNKQLILEFQDECVSQGLSDARVLFYTVKLLMISRIINKDLDKLNEKDLKALVRKIERRDYTEWTKHGYRITIKKFYQWLEKYDWNSKEYPKKVKWLRGSVRINNKKLPEEILTKDDIKKLIKNASNFRDKALVSVLYESGCRIGEVLSLKIKHVSQDEYGYIIRVFGKTGSRRIRLISSVPHLANWLSNHPHYQLLHTDLLNGLLSSQIF